MPNIFGAAMRVGKATDQRTLLILRPQVPLFSLQIRVGSCSISLLLPASLARPLVFRRRKREKGRSPVSGSPKEVRFSMGSGFFLFGPPITPIADHHGMIDFRFGSFPPLSSGRDGGGERRVSREWCSTSRVTFALVNPIEESLGFTPHCQG